MKLAERNSASSPQRACSGTTLRLGRFDTVIRVAVATPESRMANDLNVNTFKFKKGM
jgi:hypothetical protein